MKTNVSLYRNAVCVWNWVSTFSSQQNQYLCCRTISSRKVSSAQSSVFWHWHSLVDIHKCIYYWNVQFLNIVIDISDHIHIWLSCFWRSFCFNCSRRFSNVICLSKLLTLSVSDEGYSRNASSFTIGVNRSTHWKSPTRRQSLTNLIT